MRRRISVRTEQWLPVAADEPAIRINWLRVAFAGLLVATITILVTLRLQATGEHNAQAVSNVPTVAIEVSSAPKADFQATSEHPRAAYDGLSAATQVSSATRADFSPTLQLVAEPAAQGTDDRLPLGIFIRGPSEIASAAAIDIIGLPNGWALSAGWPFANGWRIPAARLAGAVILPPRGFSGAIDFAAELRLADNTVVEHRLVRRVRIDPGLAEEKTVSLLRVAEGLLAAGDIAAARLVLRRAAEAGNARAALLLGETSDQVRIDPGLADDKTVSLLRVAESLLAARNISAARLALRRAAEAGNARAALLLGETYDGCLIRRLNCSADADPATARTWYEVAAEFGSTDARQRLDRLARDQPGGDLPSRR
jgi:TPR repeat protein